MTSPLPPSGIQLGISTVMAGQILTDLTTGAETIAMQDQVLLIEHRDGEQTGSWQMTPEQAMAIAKGLSKAVGSLLAAEIDEQGKPTGFAHRLKKLGTL